MLFESAVNVYGNKQLGVILTGMGYDGREGARALVKAGANVYAQDEETCVVWGMPRGVVEAGLACHEYPIQDMGRAITERVSKPGRRLPTAGGVR